MPKITSYNQPWLAKPSPGHDLFTPTAESDGSQGGHSAWNTKGSRPGARRTIARRGTEVFVAVGKEIRWADLVYLKSAQEDEQRRRSSKGKYVESQYTENRAQGYRTLKTPVADNIRQLVMSPRADFIAILTHHTVHIAVIPDRSCLTAADTTPIRIKAYTIGPTTHVTTQPAVATALWHPLGVSGLCLVTVTRDAVVRVWELSVADGWSFDRPTLSINLQKLADGTSLDQDFSASTAGFGKSLSFSPDSVEMEVASACFASRGSGGWSPMTLWIAMKEGDVYALCPLLPEKWSPPATLIPSLSVAVVANIAAMEDDPDVSQQKRLLAQQQLAWMSDIDSQEPLVVDGPDGEQDEVYTRPSKPGKIPKLQGPFEFELAPPETSDELDGMLSDIYVIGPKADAEQLMFGEDDELDIDEADQGLSIGIVCLLTLSGRLSVCLDIEGVEAQWLPKSKSKVIRYDEDDNCPSLLTYNVMDTITGGELWDGNWPMFSPDLESRYSFYVTNTSNVVFVSLSPWVFRLETELEEGAAGTDFRIDLLAKSQNSIRERIHRQKFDDHSDPLSACTLFRDSDLGYFLLTANSRGPQVVIFEAPADEFQVTETFRSRSPSYDSERDKPLIIHEPRPVYEPAHQLDVKSSLPLFLEKLRNSKYKRILKEEVKLSPATLTIMTDAHKLLSEETHRLGGAAAELFRRIEILQEGLRSHIKKANEVAARVETIAGEDIKEGPVVTSNDAIEKRIEAAQERNKVLAERLDKLRMKVSQGTTRSLSDKERLWMEEVATTKSKIMRAEDLDESELEGTNQPWERYEKVQEEKERLIQQAEDLGTAQKENRNSPRGIKVPAEIRKMKTAQIMKLLDRETALVEGAKSRLERLTLVE